MVIPLRCSVPPPFGSLSFLRCRAILPWLHRAPISRMEPAHQKVIKLIRRGKKPLRCTKRSRESRRGRREVSLNDFVCGRFLRSILRALVCFKLAPQVLRCQRSVSPLLPLSSTTPLSVSRTFPQGSRQHQKPSARLKIVCVCVSVWFTLL